jgi:hypothetical protein
MLGARPSSRPVESFVLADIPPAAELGRQVASESRMTKRIRTFYLAAIWMPLVLPAIATAGFAVRGGGTFAGVGADIGFLLVLSATLGGAPYGFVALWASWWVMRRADTESQVRRLMLVAPLVVTPVAMLWWTVTFGIKEGLMSGAIYAVWFALYLLPIGYLYVLGTVIAREVIRSMGCIPTSEVAAP